MYYFADVLSLLECLFAGSIVVFTITGADPGIILILFGLGELCDAFDGICARRWPYPDDNVYRFWRQPDYIRHMEWTKDIVLGLATLIFIIVRIDLTAGLIGTIVALVLGAGIQLWIDHYWVIALYSEDCDVNKQTELFEKIEHFYLIRRTYLYVPGLATLVLLLLFSASWSLTVKMLLTFFLCIGGIWLFNKKQDRLTSEKIDGLPDPSILSLKILKLFMSKHYFTHTMRTKKSVH